MDEKVRAFFSKERIMTESSDLARDLFAKGCFGTPISNGHLQLGMFEVIYLFEKEKLDVMDGRNKPLSFEALLKKAKKSLYSPEGTAWGFTS